MAWGEGPGGTSTGRILAAKLVYGPGDGRYRGAYHYSARSNGMGPVEVVEIAAAGEESLVQVAAFIAALSPVRVAPAPKLLSLAGTGAVDQGNRPSTRK